MGGPVLLSGSTFSNIQNLLLSGYACKELETQLGEKNLYFPASWMVVGNTNQITPLSYQENQNKIILVISGSAYIICNKIKKKDHHNDSVIFNMRAGSSEVLWIPEIFAQGFYFLSQNTVILLAATSLRNNFEQALDPLDPTYNIDLSALTGLGKANLKTNKAVEI